MNTNKFVKNMFKVIAKAMNRKADINHTHDNMIRKTGDAMTGELNLLAGSTVKSMAGNTGVGGYVIFMQIEITTQYVNYPLIFELSGRARSSTRVIVIFGSVNSTDPHLSTFCKMGYTDYPIYIRKVSTSTWQLCVQKSEGYGRVDVTELHNTCQWGIKVTILGSGADQINTADFVASEWTEATITGTVAHVINVPQWKLLKLSDISINEILDVDITSIKSSAAEFLLIIGIPNTGNTTQIYGGKTYVIPNRDYVNNIITDKLYYSGNYSASGTGQIRSSLVYMRLDSDKVVIQLKDDGPLRLRLYWR